MLKLPQPLFGEAPQYFKITWHFPASSQRVKGVAKPSEVGVPLLTAPTHALCVWLIELQALLPPFQEQRFSHDAVEYNSPFHGLENPSLLHLFPSSHLVS